jgi:hypothetical protein
MNRGYFLLIIAFIFLQDSFSQNKYALLIGINKYQKKNKNGTIGIDSVNTLHGCVNDAKSIKGLIVNQFGFKPANIKELYDFNATKKNILSSINTLLLKCKPGDIAVIYYAGHGSTSRYGTYEPQTHEYILPTDVFTNYRFINGSQNNNTLEYTFIQTSLLASLFNKFVDKKVVLTALFDCCYSKGTIGVKKTISTSKLISGVPKILNYTFWENAVEMSRNTTFPKRRNGLIEFPAFNYEINNACNEEFLQKYFSEWLARNGNATLNDTCKQKFYWTNNFNSSNWEKLCGKTRQIKVLFSVKDDCGNTDTTSAYFIITDGEKPKIYEPAKDITIEPDIISKETALQKWLAVNGGALATDGCSDSIIWTNNFDKSLKSYFEASGSALVTFTAKDACSNSDFVRATITVKDEINPVDYRLTAQETDAIITLLNNLEEIRKNATRYNYFTQAPTLRDAILKQLDTIEIIKTLVNKKTNYTETGNFDAIQGTSLMASLIENTDYLLILLSQIPYREEDQLTENNFSDAPSDSIKEESNGISRNANNLKLIFPVGFPYKEYDFNPPSLIPGSRFVFMSATNDVQRAKENKINNVTHGLFTAAIIEVFKNNPAGTKITDVFEKVKQQLKQWNAVQTPTLRVSEKRKDKNLIGTGF